MEHKSHIPCWEPGCSVMSFYSTPSCFLKYLSRTTPDQIQQRVRSRCDEVSHQVRQEQRGMDGGQPFTHLLRLYTMIISPSSYSRRACALTSLIFLPSISANRRGLGLRADDGTLLKRTTASNLRAIFKSSAPTDLARSVAFEPYRQVDGWWGRGQRLVVEAIR